MCLTANDADEWTGSSAQVPGRDAIGGGGGGCHDGAPLISVYSDRGPLTEVDCSTQTDHGPHDDDERSRDHPHRAPRRRRAAPRAGRRRAQSRRGSSCHGRAAVRRARASTTSRWTRSPCEAEVGKGTLFRRFGDRATRSCARCSRRRETELPGGVHPRPGAARPGRAARRAPRRLRPRAARPHRGPHGDLLLAAETGTRPGDALRLAGLRRLPRARRAARARGRARPRRRLHRRRRCSRRFGRAVHAPAPRRHARSRTLKAGWSQLARRVLAD